MTNPVVRLYESPVESLTDAGWLFVLLAALVATWWAAGRNVLWLDDQWGNGWKFLPPFWVAVRIVALLGIVAVDLWLMAAMLAVLG